MESKTKERQKAEPLAASPKSQSKERRLPVETLENCGDKNCHLHGSLKTRGRVFEGKVVKKLHKRVAIEFERMIYVRKYERYSKSKIRIHARLPNCMEDLIHVGDLIRVMECRPLSKIIHFVVIDKIKGKDEK